MIIQTFDENTLGLDYVIGDIHGCFSRLEEELRDLEFNADTDRLFCVGDLVDRGPESLDFFEWLAKPWFFSVRGNHDQMAIDQVYTNKFTQGEELYVRNGGQWFLNLNQATKRLVADALSELPIAIEIKTSYGTVGIVHAD